MLTVYSTQGSPGASTTAMHLAASWASEGREVLLIELDPAGGSMSHNLGIQFTPGSASFVASGLPALSNYLIDHAQDVLFENLHVMPAPASPTGARGIFNTFSDYAEDLRAISENEMAVIIDGGRITADAAASDLTARAAGVLVVCRENSQLSSLEPLKGVLDAGGGAGPKGCAVAVGKSPMEPDEWLETGLTFCGSIEIVSDMATDLSSYMARTKRKSKKWRASLEQVGETMYAYAQPPLSGASHQSHSAEPTATVDAVAAEGAEAAPVPEPAPTQDPAAYGPPPMAAPEAGYGQSHYLPPTPESQPGYGQSHYLPPTVGPGGYGQAPPPVPPEDYPGYGQPVPPPQYPPPHEQAYPPPQYPPPSYEQAPPPYEQAYPPPQYPPPPHEQPQYPPPPHEQPQYPATAYDAAPAPGSPIRTAPAGLRTAPAPGSPIRTAPAGLRTAPAPGSPIRTAPAGLRTAPAPGSPIRTAPAGLRAGPAGSRRAAGHGRASGSSRARVPSDTEHPAHRLVPGLGDKAARLER